MVLKFVNKLISLLINFLAPPTDVGKRLLENKDGVLYFHSAVFHLYIFVYDGFYPRILLRGLFAT